VLSEAAKQVQKREGTVTVKPHTSRLLKQQEDQKGIRGERGGGSVTLLGKRAIRKGEREWVLTMNSHVVDFSIAGGVEEIVRDPNPMPFFFHFFFHFFFIFFSLLFHLFFTFFSMCFVLSTTGHKDRMER